MDIKLLSNLIIKKVYSALTMYSAKGSGSVRENRKSWAIALKMEGETEYKTDSGTVISNALHPVILPKGCSYEWRCTAPGRFIIVELDAEESAKDIYSFSLSDNRSLLSLLQSVEYRHGSNSPSSHAKSLRDIYSALSLLIDSKKYTPPQKREKIRPAIEYIAKNTGAKISLEQLSSLCSMSTVYFRKLFYEVTGASPLSYRNALRIEKAKQMLKSDYSSLSEIAYSLGYNNIYEFSRDFKKRTGTPPSKY